MSGVGVFWVMVIAQVAGAWIVLTIAALKWQIDDLTEALRLLVRDGLEKRR